MTLLKPNEILFGKLGATLRIAFTVLLSAFAGALPLLLFEPIWSLRGLTDAYGAAIMLCECMTVAWAISAYASIRTRRMASSLVLAFVVSAFMLFGNALLLAIFSYNERWGALISPYFAFALLMTYGEVFDEWSLVWTMSHVVVAGFVLLFVYRVYRLLITNRLREN